MSAKKAVRPFIFVSYRFTKGCRYIPHAKPANRRLICKYRLKVLIEIEQKLMLDSKFIFFKGFVISLLLFLKHRLVSLLHDK
jgi:hypothetical protein